MAEKIIMFPTMKQAILESYQIPQYIETILNSPQGITTTLLANSLKISRMTLWKWRQGTSLPDISQFEMIKYLANEVKSGHSLIITTGNGPIDKQHLEYVITSRNSGNKIMKGDK